MPTDEVAAQRERLSKLSEAIWRINEDLDLDKVLDKVVDSARMLTGARYAVVATLDQSDELDEYRASGLTAEQCQALLDADRSRQVFAAVGHLDEPLRISQLDPYLGAIGLSDLSLPVAVEACLIAPIHHQGTGSGVILLGHTPGVAEFSRGDEELISLFASQAALVVANAQRYLEEQRARSELDTLINTSPVGVLVFDVAARAPSWINKEILRMMNSLRSPQQSLEELLGTLRLHRTDGRAMAISDLTLSPALSAGQRVLAEEIERCRKEPTRD